MTNISDALPLIEAELAHFLSRAPDGPPDVREAARQTNVLPVFYNWTGFGGISVRDGEVVWVEYEAPYRTEGVAEARLRNLMLHQAGLEYDVLKSLAPLRPVDAFDCPACEGTGVLRLDGKPEPRALCFCGGVSWLPAGTVYEGRLSSSRGSLFARLRVWVRRILSGTGD